MALNAWRFWRVIWDDNTGWGLASCWYNFNEPWTIEPKAAECGRVVNLATGEDLNMAATSHGASPARYCDCGYYSLLDPLHLMYIPGSIVLGTCEVWGTVVPHEKGYRSTYCRPTSLVLGDPVGVEGRHTLAVKQHKAREKEAAKKGRLPSLYPLAKIIPRAPHMNWATNEKIATVARRYDIPAVDADLYEFPVYPEGEDDG